MANRGTLRTEIWKLFLEELSVEVPTMETDLIETGILDSLKFVEMLFQLEQRYETCISMDDLEIANFRSIEKIAEFIASRNGVPRATGV